MRNKPTFGLCGEGEIVVHQLTPGCEHQGHGAIVSALVSVHVS